MRCRELVALDRGLAEAIAGTDPATQRRIARWTARWIATEVGLADLDWIAPALDALDRGDDLPPPFATWRSATDRLASDPRVQETEVVTGLRRRYSMLCQEHVLMWAIFDACHEEPLHAALATLYEAAVVVGADHSAFAEVRGTFL